MLRFFDPSCAIPLPKIRIGRLFHAYGRCRSVAWKNVSLVRKRPQFFAYPRNEQLVTAIRKIRAPDASIKKHVAANHDRLPLYMEADTVGRVSGDVEQIEGEPFEGKGVLPGEEMINCVRINRARHPHHLLKPFG